VLGEQRADKRLDRLPDADPDLPGHQIDNLGYPGFTASGSFAQVGLSLTFPLTARAPPEEAP